MSIDEIFNKIRQRKKIKPKSDFSRAKLNSYKVAKVNAKTANETWILLSK